MFFFENEFSDLGDRNMLNKQKFSRMNDEAIRLDSEYPIETDTKTSKFLGSHSNSEENKEIINTKEEYKREINPSSDKVSSIKEKEEKDKGMNKIEKK